MAADSPATGRPSAGPPDDATLVRQISDGRQEALAELYSRYGPLLTALAHRIVGDSGEAEEVVQEAFLQSWRQAGRYDPERSSVSTWLVLIARSRAIDRLRTQRAGERTVTTMAREAQPTHTSPAGPGDVWMQERRALLRRALAQLPAEQREVVELAFYAGLTQRQIAERNDLPLGTVKTRTLLAMRKLRASLGPQLKDLL